MILRYGDCVTCMLWNRSDKNAPFKVCAPIGFGLMIPYIQKWFCFSFLHYTLAILNFRTFCNILFPYLFLGLEKSSCTDFLPAVGCGCRIRPFTVGWERFQPKSNPPRNLQTVLESSNPQFYRFKINFYVVM